MKITFWGTRGSIPKPGPDTLRYGGNTSCIEIRSNEGTLIVIDCGTGAHGLGQKLMSEAETGRLKGHLLISHTHWDHIQGFPFFVPLFTEGTEWNIYGPQGLSQSIVKTLAGQMQYSYFPIELENLQARIHYHDLVEGFFMIDDVRIDTHYLNHTNLTLGYRIHADGATIVYACDHEPYTQQLALGKGEITGRELQHLKFLKGADMVIHDAQYTVDEYLTKVGWGHSTVDYAVKICEAAAVKKLALSHHDPMRTDDDLDKIVKEFQQQLKTRNSAMEVFGASEGQELEINNPLQVTPVPLPNIQDLDNIDFISAYTNCFALLFAEHKGIVGNLKIALEADGINYLVVHNEEDLKKEMLLKRPSLVIIENECVQGKCIELAEELHHLSYQNNLFSPIVVVSTAEEISINCAHNGVRDWLSWPFSVSYARSKIHAWVMRIACRWIRAPIPKEEEKRLEALNKLDILDTEPEERFDKITRIAADLLDVPVAYVAFIDKNRQWFKSHYGSVIEQTDREISICSHVIYNKEKMIIPDTLLDDRFAQNPLVVNEPRIRFYAGFPLTYENEVVGTFCLIDKRPRQLSSQEIKLIENLRDIVNSELQQSQPNVQNFSI